jgi:translation initiation factor 2B subunit (eIF-2B alpha/beta/delta family)
MKQKIKRFLIFENTKLIKKLVTKEIEIRELKKEIKQLELDKKELKDINFNISSNNQYLIEQRKKANKRIKQLKTELLEKEN